MMFLQVEAQLYALLAFALASLFYLLIPGLGAFLIRGRWRRFRSSCFRAAMYPLPDYRFVQASAEGSSGLFRFYGTLGALQGDSLIWLDDGNLTVKADLEGVPVYMVKDSIGGAQSSEVPEPVTMKRVRTMPEGSRMFLAGKMVRRSDGACFISDKETQLLAVLYDGREGELIYHAVKSGRERNEYWNMFTPASLALGSFSLFILFYLLLQDPLLRFPSILSLSGSLVPLAPLLPPATPAFSVYRSLWSRARKLRAERDLLQLPRPQSLIGGGIYRAEPLTDPSQAAEFMPGAIPLALEEGQKQLVLLAVQKEGRFLVSRDPCAPALVMPELGAQLAQRKQKQAVRMELQALGILGFGLLFEIGLLFSLFSALIR